MPYSSVSRRTDHHWQRSHEEQGIASMADRSACERCRLRYPQPSRTGGVCRQGYQLRQTAACTEPADQWPDDSEIDGHLTRGVDLGTPAVQRGG